MSINGGIADLDTAERLLAPEDGLPGLDGVMLGARLTRRRAS